MVRIETLRGYKIMDGYKFSAAIAPAETPGLSQIRGDFREPSNRCNGKGVVSNPSVALS